MGSREDRRGLDQDSEGREPDRDRDADDVRHHFVRGFIEDGTFEVEFVKTLDNSADIYTKNTGGELFIKHTSGYMQEVEYTYK